ncbi:sigma factor [Nannocystis punicea]|uniref:Sigma factor n=1 Tax=Nannocystis punicea TaxID=2995304 RepID=A0ABY7GSF5_9BACT|nr:sigma factor [Nannocystis poenicansa]WAS89799.1 sigma factor [Nannocystis poenicansa]
MSPAFQSALPPRPPAPVASRERPRDVAPILRQEPAGVAVRCFELRAELWRALLGQPGVLPWIGELARRLLHPELHPGAALRRLELAAQGLGHADQADDWTAYEAARRAAADALGPADPDRCLARRLVDELLARPLAQPVDPAVVRWCTAVQRRHAALEAALNLLRARDEQIGRLVRAMRPPGQRFSELVGAASQGLQWAMGRYDPRRGGRFDSFAEWWIRHLIRRTLAGPRPRSELRTTCSQFFTLHGRAPTDEELTTLTGEPIEQIRLARAPWLLDRNPHEKGPTDALA